MLPSSFVPNGTAIMVPKTSDGRVLFAIPWKGRTIVGTTDTPMENIDEDPKPLDEEIDFILQNANRYLEKSVDRSDVLSVYAGLRPLVRPPKGSGNTATISRDHTIQISDTNLITIAGGKWTTFRKMGEDTIDRAIQVTALEPKPCRTQSLPLHGASQDKDHTPENWKTYGSDAVKLQSLVEETPSLGESLHPTLPYTKAEIVHAIREEMARTVEDLLSRRTRVLIQDAKAAMEVAPIVAKILTQERGKDETWAAKAVDEFNKIAERYLP